MPRPRPPLYEVRYAPKAHRGHHWKIVGYPEGRRQQHWFASEKAAKSRADDLNEEITAHGTQAILAPELRIMALHCQGKLEPFKKSLLDATDFYIKHLEATNRSVPINHLTAAVGREFQRRMTAGECSQRHCETMLGALRPLEARLGGRASSTITSSELKAWLSGSEWATKTRNNLLNYWGNAFNVAIELKMLSVNPLTGTKPFNASKVSKKDNPKVPDGGTDVGVAQPCGPQPDSLPRPLWLCRFALVGVSGLGLAMCGAESPVIDRAREHQQNRAGEEGTNAAQPVGLVAAPCSKPRAHRPPSPVRGIVDGCQTSRRPLALDTTIPKLATQELLQLSLRSLWQCG